MDADLNLHRTIMMLTGRSRSGRHQTRGYQMAEKSTRARSSEKRTGKMHEKTPEKITGAKAAVKSSKAKAGAVAKTKEAAKPSKKKAAFKLRAPEASQVFVVGCFNEWNPTATPLMQEEEGTWTCALMLEPGEHEYRFVVDGAWWDDPAALERRPNEFGSENCIIIV